MDIKEDILSNMLIHCSRDINQLCDSNRTINRVSMQNLTTMFADKSTNAREKQFLFENHMLKNFLIVMDSHSDSVREAAINFLRKLLELYHHNKLVANGEIQTLIVEKLFSRVQRLPYPENIEEIRLEIVKLSIVLVELFDIGVRKSMKLVQEALSSLLKDKYAEVKKMCCGLIEKLCEKYPIEFSLNIKDVLFSLVVNCQHSHYKVRKDSSAMLDKLLSLPTAGVYLEDVFPCLYQLQDDKHADVSLNSYECVGRCLIRFELTHIKQFEDRMILFMLTGLLREESKQLAEKYISEFGKRRKELKEKFDV